MAREQAGTSVLKHRRDTWLWIIVPLGLLMLLVLAGVVVTVLLPHAAQKSVISNVMLIVLMLCPLAVCTLPLTIGMIAAVFGMNFAHTALAKPLRKVEGYSLMMTERTRTATERINQAAIDVSARFGFVYKLLDTFEEKSDHTDQGEDKQDGD